MAYRARTSAVSLWAEIPMRSAWSALSSILVVIWVSTRIRRGNINFYVPCITTIAAIAAIAAFPALSAWSAAPASPPDAGPP